MTQRVFGGKSLAEMNPEIAEALTRAIEAHLVESLDRCYWHKIYIEEDQLELLVKEKEISFSQTVIIRLTVAEQLREMHISNIFMLDFMRRQSIGKGLIATIYGVGKSFGYSLFLVQMTESFFTRMKRRGARVIEEDDCVQITDETNLNPSA